ncbi:MAG: hypothetical protein C4532_18180 [Candidatus Abyssobacteria bacterium SURF_17]|uniref:Uncharacterized protein n=1 Tax=Candidatus Abyssobacteria bacterium SURF_17 TaxID=2093361 RepID=A0A419EPY2_9BACT|nr:MAG: hypothetical protein C4532_18180 [Candidatus Abyssubacteria bacterium SURF_17]
MPAHLRSLVYYSRSPLIDVLIHGFALSFNRPALRKFVGELTDPALEVENVPLVSLLQLLKIFSQGFHLFP